MRLPQPCFAALVAISLLAGGSTIGSACPVPVFRYALELWPPDSYQLYLFHHGELEDSEQALVARLRSASKPSDINLRLTTLDIEANLEPVPRAVWESLETKELSQPILVLQSPPRHGPATTVLTLELTEQNVDQLLDSPHRQEIARRIINGDSVGTVDFRYLVPSPDLSDVWQPWRPSRSWPTSANLY